MAAVKLALLAIILILSSALAQAQRPSASQIAERVDVLAKQALAQRSDTVDVFARRGSIMDRDGNVLVRSLPSESVYAVPHDLTDPDKTVTELQHVLGKVDAQTVVALHDKHLQFYWIARKIAHVAVGGEHPEVFAEELLERLRLRRRLDDDDRLSHSGRGTVS